MRNKTGFPISLFLIAAVLATVSTGCSELRPSRPIQAETQSSVFVAPPLAPIPTVLIKVENTLPTQIADCKNELTYISDLTIPDGTHFDAGAKMEKQWQVKNSGTCNWMEGYSIHLVGGDAMGAAETQGLVPARSGSEAVLQVDFTAPQTPGEYNSSWQAFDPQGQAFGDKVFIQIIVNTP